MNSEVITISDAMQFVNRLSLSKEERKVIDSIRQYDINTFLHSVHVAMLTKQLMEYRHYAKEDIIMGSVAALLHDAGKLEVPYEIINKPGKLTMAERDLITQHSDKALSVLRNCDELIQLVALTHHLDSSKVDELTQMVAVCDIYSANRLERAYKTMSEPASALNNTIESKILDPETLADFQAMWEKYPEITKSNGKYVDANKRQNYEQLSFNYVALKYHLNERSLEITHNPNYIVYNHKKVIAVLSDKGTIVAEPHEVEMLGNSRLFERDVEWPEKDESILSVDDYEKLLSEQELM